MHTLSLHDALPICSKNTLADLKFLHEKGFTEELQKLCGKTWILGICGGFQILGESVEDPHEMEAGGSGTGLGLLSMTTILEGDKKLFVSFQYSSH